MSDPNLDWEQMREFVRINVSLPIWCRKIKKEDLPEKKEEFALRPSALQRMGWNTTRIGDKRRDNVDTEGELNHLFLRLLWDVSQKLDRLLDLLENKRSREPDEWQVKALDLSGSGIRIISPKEIDIDEYLQMEMNIPLFPVKVIPCIGKVIWVKSIDEKEPVKWEAGLIFVAINEDDREEIIRFVFQQQTMLLRARGLAG